MDQTESTTPESVMILDPDDAERFFTLHKALTLFVGQRLKIAERAQGRGRAILEGDEIEGRILIHRGDESAFRALRESR